jgi:hypothetical protein
MHPGPQTEKTEALTLSAGDELISWTIAQLYRDPRRKLFFGSAQVQGIPDATTLSRILNLKLLLSILRGKDLNRDVYLLDHHKAAHDNRTPETINPV